MLQALQGQRQDLKKWILYCKFCMSQFEKGWILYGMFCVIWSDLERDAYCIWLWNALFELTLDSLNVLICFVRFKLVVPQDHTELDGESKECIRDYSPGTIESGMRLWKLKELKELKERTQRTQRAQRAGGMSGTYEIADSELDVRNVTAHNCKCDARPIANAQVEILHVDASHLHPDLRWHKSLAWNRVGTGSLQKTWSLKWLRSSFLLNIWHGTMWNCWVWTMISST